MWMNPKCKNPEVTSRYHSWVAANSNLFSPSRSCISVMPPPPVSDRGLATATSTNTATFTAMSTLVTSIIWPAFQ